MGRKGIYMVSALFLSVMLGFVPVFGLTPPESSVTFDGSDSTGDVVDMTDFNNVTYYDDPSIDIVYGSVDMDTNEVIIELKVSGNINTVDNTSLYVMNVYDSSGNYVSFSYSAGEMYQGSNYVPSDYFSVSGSVLQIYPPYSYFDSLTDIYKVQFAAYFDPNDSDSYYGDALTIYSQSGSSGSGSDETGGTGNGTSEGTTGVTGGAGDTTNISSLMVTQPNPLESHESPTDTTVSISITYIHLVIKDLGDKIEQDYTIRGNSNNAKEIWVSSAAYYNDTGFNWGGFWIKGPFHVPEGSDIDGRHYYEFYMKGTGSGGSLSSWEFRLHFTSPKKSNPDFSMTKMRAYARAFSDGGWNQAYRDYDVQVSSDGKTMTAGTDVSSESSSSSGIPGFEAITMMAAMGLIVGVYSTRRKK